MEQQIVNWWNNLAQREQVMLLLVSVVAAIGILYWGIWYPVANAEHRAELELRAQQQTLAYVKQTANKIITLRKTTGHASFSGSLGSVVNNAANSNGLEITRMQPQGNKIQIWMDDVSFNQLLKFLSQLVQQKGLSLDSLDISASDKPGIVQVRRIQLSH